jgi:hypothetical protein
MYSGRKSPLYYESRTFKRFSVLHAVLMFIVAVSQTSLFFLLYTLRAHCMAIGRSDIILFCAPAVWGLVMNLFVLRRLQPAIAWRTVGAVVAFLGEWIGMIISFNVYGT